MGSIEERTEPDWATLVPEVTLRSQQTTALSAIWKAFFVDGLTTVLLEAPTGVGKSIIELALCRYEASLGGSSYIVTPQRQLQDQLRAWEGLRVMKGRSSYQCELMGPGVTAASAPCLGSPSVRDGHPDTCSDDHCPYYGALKLAKESSVVVHNYASIMAQSRIGRHFGPRGLACFDEGHTAASWIRNFMTCDFDPNDLAALTDQDPPKKTEDFLPWIRRLLSEVLDGDEVQLPRGAPETVKGVILKVAAHRREYGLVDVREARRDWSNDQREEGFDEWLFEHLRGSSSVPWVTQRIEPDRWHPEGQWSTIPLRVAPMGRILTGMGSRTLVVTATVLNKALLCAEIGLDATVTGFVRIDSAFEARNRPIVKRYAGSMSFRNKAATFPRLIDRLVQLAQGHSREQGLVHSVSHDLSYRIVQALRERLQGRPVVMLPRGTERDRTIAQFLAGGLGPHAILVGPSMMEGVDGKDDSCRWQAMCKVPWPNMGDPVVDHIVGSGGNWGRSWYAWKTAQSSVQGFGRVCRSSVDHGITYLLDSDFDRVLTRDYIPPYVLEAVS